MELTTDFHNKLLAYQKQEITEYSIYQNLAKAVKSAENRQILETISQGELRHYQDWKKYTGQEVSPNRFSVWKYSWIGRILGLTFSLKLMERGEEKAQVNYAELQPTIPEIDKWIKDEDEHEQALPRMNLSVNASSRWQV